MKQRRERARPSSNTRNGSEMSRLGKLKPQCHFGNKCHYAHKDPVTDEPYVFSSAELAEMKRKYVSKRTRGRLQLIEQTWEDILHVMDAWSLDGRRDEDSSLRSSETSRRTVRVAEGEVFEPAFFYDLYPGDDWEADWEDGGDFDDLFHLF